MRKEPDESTTVMTTAMQRALDISVMFPWFSSEDGHKRRSRAGCDSRASIVGRTR